MALMEPATTGEAKAPPVAGRVVEVEAAVATRRGAAPVAAEPAVWVQTLAVWGLAAIRREALAPVVSEPGENLQWGAVAEARLVEKRAHPQREGRQPLARAGSAARRSAEQSAWI